MKIKFTNLGPLKEGTFDLNKKLILLTGPNKSGKSWVAYSLYGVMREFSEIRDPHFFQEIKKNERIIAGFQSVDDKNITFKLDDDMCNELDLFFREYMHNMTNAKLFPFYLGHLNYKPASTALPINFIFNDNKETILNIINSEYSEIEMGYDINGYRYRCKIYRENTVLYIQVSDLSNEEVSVFTSIKFKNLIFSSDLNSSNIKYYIISTFIRQIFTSFFFNRVFFLPAERTYMNQVARDLSDYKANLFDQRKYLGDKNEDRSAGATWAIREYENFINRLRPTRESTDSIPKYKSLAEGRLAKLIGGQLDVNDFGRIIYSEEEKPIPYHLTSSSIKMLSGLDFYLRFYMWMDVNHSIFIDEPELHLHADAQLEFAKLIGQMVNARIQVVVSTHSELIIRQLNHLIYLNRPEAKDSPKWAEFCKAYDYQENDFLTPDDVAVYFFDGKGGCESLDIDETGFSVPTIETVLMQLNEEIYTFNDDILPSN